MSKHNNKNAGVPESELKINPGDGSPEAGDKTRTENQDSRGADAGDADTVSGAQNPESQDWARKAAEYEAKIAELNDQYLRKAADFENYRKRVNREKQELTDFANQNLLLDLIPVIDDFERAIKSAETSKDFTGFYEGIMMIEKRLSSQLENKWGLKRFDSVGEVFDPNRHEALQVEKVPGVTEAVVRDEFVKGYFLKERVIRFAKVKVFMPGDGESVPPAGDNPGSGT